MSRAEGEPRVNDEQHLIESLDACLCCLQSNLFRLHGAASQQTQENEEWIRERKCKFVSDCEEKNERERWVLITRTMSEQRGKSSARDQSRCAQCRQWYSTRTRALRKHSLHSSSCREQRSILIAWRYFSNVSIQFFNVYGNRRKQLALDQQETRVEIYWVKNGNTGTCTAMCNSICYEIQFRISRSAKFMWKNKMDGQFYPQ